MIDFHPLIPQKRLKKLQRWTFQPVPLETFVAGEAPEEAQPVVIGEMGVRVVGEWGDGGVVTEVIRQLHSGTDDVVD